TKEVGIYRLNLAPHASIPLHMHKTMRESEMVLGEGLLCQGRQTPKGFVHRWPLGAAHCYENPTDRVQSILCIDSPPSREDDEVLVKGEPALVIPEQAWTISQVR